MFSRHTSYHPIWPFCRPSRNYPHFLPYWHIVPLVWPLNTPGPNSCELAIVMECEYYSLLSYKAVLLSYTALVSSPCMHLFFVQYLHVLITLHGIASCNCISPVLPARVFCCRCSLFETLFHVLQDLAEILLSLGHYATYTSVFGCFFKKLAEIWPSFIRMGTTVRYLQGSFLCG